jgi:site-specific DNA-methyltransferase (adenine-specific)
MSEQRSRHSVIIGDSRAMPEIADRSVELVVTSPPYWQLKDFGSPEQIGFDDTYEEYINNLNLVWSEYLRVLRDGRWLCVNIGDQFARSVYYGRYKIMPIRTEIIRFCETIGFDYMGAIIWQKVTTCHTSGGATIMGSFPYPRNGILTLDYEFILIFKKPGTPPKVGKAIKEQSALTIEEWNRYFAGHWNFPGLKQGRHLAIFPEELPRRLIKMFCFVGETVVDPFLGSGTTSLAARNLGRKSIGYEINPAFALLIREKICGGSAAEAPQVTITPRSGTVSDLDERRKKPPYQFVDPVHFNKRTDPRLRSFGSRIE